VRSWGWRVTANLTGRACRCAPHAMSTRRPSLRLRRWRVLAGSALAVAAVVAALTVPGAWGSDGEPAAYTKAVLHDEAQGISGRFRADVAPTSAPVTTTAPPTTVATTAPAPTTTTLPEYVGPGGTSAWARGDHVDVFDEPGGTEPARTFANPARFGAPLVFLVAEQRDDGWLHVWLPERPNRGQGWIQTHQVQLVRNDWRVTVDISDHHMVVTKGSDTIYDETVATGQAAFPTPTGSFYVTAVLWTDNPGGAYGPAAIALSAFSDVLTEFGGGDGQVALHGTNQPNSIGRDASHGCVRLPNEVDAGLASQIPLGTPVEIVE
jgi:lipoprotein-anchoring transpeptidase ErfK/SrfK